MLFSIIVPVYKVEEYLERCVKSILDQTCTDIEIILVDDGSPDKCPEICDCLQMKDNRIKVIHKENGGLSSARNAGLNAAKGDFILFVDSDDIIEADTCEKFKYFINNDPDVDIFIGLLKNVDGTYYSHRSDAVIGEVYKGSDYFNLFNNSIIPCAVASVYRRQFLCETNRHFIEGRYHEDIDFTPKTYISANKIVYTGIEFYVRYIREESITQHKDKRKNLQDMLFIARGLEVYAKSIPDKISKKYVLDNACMAYLSMFYEADIFQYKDAVLSQYIDKKFVLTSAKSLRNRIKALIFCISPHAYVEINRKVKGINDTRQL